MSPGFQWTSVSLPLIKNFFRQIKKAFAMTRIIYYPNMVRIRYKARRRAITNTSKGASVDGIILLSAALMAALPDWIGAMAKKEGKTI
jgi:hypothetical protein